MHEDFWTLDYTSCQALCNYGIPAARQQNTIIADLHVPHNPLTHGSRHSPPAVFVQGKMGDGVPLVKVDQRPGREKWRKEQFSQRIAKTIADELTLGRKNWPSSVVEGR